MKLRSSDSLLAGLIFILIVGGCNPKRLTPQEGYIEVTGGTVWYRIYGARDKSPLLVLHGGPGASSYGLEPMKALSYNRQVIFIDQLGSGRSTRITDTTLMTVDNFVEQVEQVKKALNLKDLIVFGHSWGSTLALEYYLKYPREVKAIIFSSPLFSTDLWIKDADTLISTLPDSIQVIIRESEKNRTFGSEAYKDAVELYYSKFLWRKPLSKSQADSTTMFFGANVYEFMWGPSEFTATGNLLNYDRVEDLDEITVPTLLLTGEYDEARPVTVKYFQSMIPGSEFMVIKNSGHATMNDNPQEAIALITKFLLKYDN